MSQQVGDSASVDLATRHSLTRNLLPSEVVMIQCVGPAEKYCGRICCSTALKNALKLKDLNPKAQVAVLYKDMRTYGFHERLYTEARRQGVLFLRYDDEHKPEVVVGQRVNEATSQRGNGAIGSEAVGSELIDLLTHNSSTLEVKAWDPILGQEITLRPDLLVLSMPMVPAEGAKELGTKLKVPVDLDGWFQEAHVKLRPVDFASDGVFMAGAAHYPKLLDETIVQARAAAARAATILTKEALNAGGIVAQVNPELCVGCLTCVRVCPYSVPRITADFTGVGGILGAAFIDPAVCQGCGTCVAECPARAIQLAHYRDEQMEIKVNVLMEPAMLAAGQRVNELMS